MHYILKVTDSSPGDIQAILDEHRIPEASEIVMTAAERLHEKGWKEGRQEGRQEGRKEGHKQGREQNQRENLRLLLSQRFGPLPAPVLARIRRAGLARLQHWFERGITARNLDTVFADEP